MKSKFIPSSEIPKLTARTYKYSGFVEENFKNITKKNALQIDCESVKETNKVYAGIRNYMGKKNLFERYKIKRPGTSKTPERSNRIFILLK